MYETLKVWETDPALAEHSDVTRDFAEVWRAAEKVVYSNTLEAVSTRRTRLERAFDPESVRAIKESAEADLSVGGPVRGDQRPGHAGLWRRGLVAALRSSSQHRGGSGRA
jgi:hypothetical protein